ncbi:fibronectin type III domain-containing protein [Belliella sp. DSM 111904]|uniref:Fibronectin type III domain-containing protein n=1 Tax=Belliella filtrata TaxID=2923435 RepID=A0ABS9UVM0_9BACT|nr:DUF5123 domain-containing protein [Belliella filtrata]MCH7408088.1 fibronectin type III domain-containing protein [Belliella filtrata]
MEKSLIKQCTTWWAQLLGLALCIVFYTGCKDLQEFTLDTIPSPSDLQIDREGRNATLSWTQTPDSRINSYEVQLGTDADFSSILSTDTLEVGEQSFTFMDLESEESYAARVRALNPDPLINSYYASITFISNTIENIFRVVNNEHLGIGQVLLRWNAPEEGTVTRLVLTPTAGGDQVTLDLNPDQIAAREARVEGLSENRLEYKAEIFDGDIVRGELFFFTLDINSAITIEGESYANLQAAINAASSGAVIRIGSSTYNFSEIQNGTILVDGKSLTIEAATENSNKPEIILRNFELRGDIGYLNFKGIKIHSISKAQTSQNNDYNKHIFGASYVTGQFNLELLDCDLSGAESGLIFTQGVGAASAPEPIAGSGIFGVTIENSLLHSFGNAGGDFIDFRSGSISSVQIKNTSIWNSARALLRADPDVSFTGTDGFVLDHVTVNSVCDGGRFVDVRANGRTVIRNSIITNKVSNHGNRMQNGASLVIQNSNLFGSNINNITAGATMTDRVEFDPQYTNASSGNFSIQNAALKALSIGDPRWF